jgi:glycerol dehydrogenase-like iron-containing ADH family enzyme
MKQTAIFPGRYIQAEGAIGALAEEVGQLGANALIVAGGTAERTILPRYLQAWRERVAVTVGLAEASEDDLRRVAEGACAEGETIYHEPCRVSVDAVIAALKTADRFGHGRPDRFRPTS